MFWLAKDWRSSDKWFQGFPENLAIMPGQSQCQCFLSLTDVYKRQGYAPGESIAFDFENGSGTYTYQGKIAGSFVSADTYLVIPEGVYRSMNPRGTAYGYLWVDCDKKDVASVEQSLNTLISNTSHIKMDTYHAQLQYAEVAARMMKLGCYLFMAVVGLIGFMNMANTMIINITTKKQEYGVLQAVGMTNKQLNLRCV